MLQITNGAAAVRRVRAGDRLRILHVVPTYLPAYRYGGPIRSVHALCKHLVRRGHKVQVFTTSVDGPQDLDVPLDAPVDIDGVLVNYFPVPRARRLYWSPELARELRSSIDRFDAVHLHSVFLWPTWAAARIAENAGVPYVMSPRGMLGREVIRRKSRWIKSAWIRLIERRTIHAAAAIHVTADLEREEIQGLGLRTPPIHSIPNGVSWPASHGTLAEGPHCGLERPYALFLSRIDAKKGLDRLVEAWRFVPALTLIIAGNDESGYRAELERRVAANGLEPRIRFIGAVSDEHKWALYENAAMFLLPSYSENFGNVVAEAMAMGCPVIVTPQVGLARLVHESCAGIVTDGDPPLLAETVRTLFEDPARRRLMGERGRFTARRQLSWESAAARMEALYRQIGSRRARGAAA